MQKLLLAVALIACAQVLTGCVGVAVVGAGTVAVMADDRRTTGVYVEDENIEWKAIGRMREEFQSQIRAAGATPDCGCATAGSSPGSSRGSRRPSPPCAGCTRGTSRCRATGWPC